MGAAQPVVLVSGGDPESGLGGHPSYVQAHALAAQAAGFEPHIFAISDRDGLRRAEFGVMHRVAARPRQLVLAPVFHRALSRAVARFLAGCNHPGPHIIHGFGLWTACAVDAAEELRRAGIRAVPIASCYTTEAHEWRAVLRSPRAHGDLKASLWYAAWYPWVLSAVARTERRGYRRARLVLVNYDKVAQLLADAHGPRPGVRRIAYAAPAAFRSDGRAQLPEPLAELRPADAPLVVSVSRHDARKGLDVLLRALAALRNQGVPFRACLVGPGRLLEAHRSLAGGLELTDSVVIPGAVEDVMPYLAQADVFVLPSLQEGSGSLSLLEALQAGAAVVASDLDGIPEDIQDGQQGMLVTPGDAGSLAQALERVLRDERLRARLAAAGRELYERRFSREQFIAAIGAIYAEARQARIALPT